MDAEPIVPVMRRVPQVLPFILAFWLIAAVAGAQSLEAGESGRVQAVESPVTLRLDSGLIVRLSGVTGPVEPDRAAASRAALEQLALNKTVTLHYSGERRDRYGRAVAHVRLGQTWLQDALAQQGWVMAESVRWDATRARAIQQAEARARNAGAGHWEEGGFAVLGPDPNPLAQKLDSFQIIEGIIVEAVEVRDWRYLNFGLDWRTDFTVSIPRQAWARFEDADMSLAELEGARIRVRGWLAPRNGPMITADHPEAIEVLD